MNKSIFNINKIKLKWKVSSQNSRPDKVSHCWQLHLFLEFIQNLKAEWIKGSQKEIEILQSLRLGTQDYDFDTVKIINKGGQGIIFEIKSKVDGKTYVGKRL